MTKIAFAAQYKHPEWQKRRLECLEASGWKCEECGDSGTTLHVHHRQYFKGRMIWEYANGELAVLCEPCHSAEHGELDILKQLLASWTYGAGDVAALLAGYLRHADWYDPGLMESARQSQPNMYAAGFVAYLAYSTASIEDMQRIAAFAASLLPEHAEARLHYQFSRGNTFGEE